MANDSSTGGYLAPIPGDSLAPQDSSFDSIIQAWTASIVGLPGNMVRPRWQSIPPTQPEVSADWCAIGVTREVPDEGTLISSHKVSGQYITQLQVAVEILASFYGPNAYANASLLARGMMVAQNREPLQLQNMNIRGMPDPLRFVGELVNQKMQRKVDVPFVMRVSLVDVWNILSILSAQGTVYPERSSDAFNAPPTGMPGS